MTDLKELIAQCRSLKLTIEGETEILKGLKERLREFMIDEGIDKYDGVAIRRSFSAFDLELLRLEKPELFERYTTREEHTIVTFENVISREKLKLLQKEHPELWNDSDYRKERTTSVYGL